MTDEPDDQSTPMPKLTIGQCLLTALPSLPGGSRPAPSDADGGDESDTASPRSRARGGSGPSDGADGADEDGGDEGEDADGGDGADRTSVRPRRSAAAGAARGPSPYQDWKPEQLRRAMKYLDDRERRLAIMAGPVLVGLNVALTFVTLHNNHRYIAGKLNKAYEAPSAILALGIGSAVVAGIVVVSAFFRRRSFTIFTLLFAGYGGGPVTLLPAWGLAAWLFIRFNRMQKVVRIKEGTAAGRGGAGRGGGATRGASTARGRTSTNPRAAARAGAAAGRDRVGSRRPRQGTRPGGTDAVEALYAAQTSSAQATAAELSRPEFGVVAAFGALGASSSLAAGRAGLRASKTRPGAARSAAGAVSPGVAAPVNAPWAPRRGLAAPRLL